MPARNSKGRFIKGGGGKSLVRYRTKHITKYKTRHVKVASKRRSRRHGGSSGITLPKIIVGGLAIGALVGKKAIAPEPVKKFFAETVPGGKTFGPEATFGAIALGVDHFLWRNPWLRAAGYLGLGLAALKVGSEQTDFKFVGDDDELGDDDYMADVD
jgi:hypothetical protein